MPRRKVEPSRDNIAEFWQTSIQIMGIRAQLKAAINRCDNGAYVNLDIATARKLLIVCLQAEHTERGHGE